MKRLTRNQWTVAGSVAISIVLLLILGFRGLATLATAIAIGLAIVATLKQFSGVDGCSIVAILLVLVGSLVLIGGSVAAMQAESGNWSAPACGAVFIGIGTLIFIGRDILDRLGPPPSSGPDSHS